MTYAQPAFGLLLIIASVYLIQSGIRMKVDQGNHLGKKTKLEAISGGALGILLGLLILFDKVDW